MSDILRRFLRNASLIVGSRLAFGLMNLATNALVARVYGLAELGAVLLLMAYVRLFAEIVKFQSWQAILRFGADLEVAGDRRGLRRLLGIVLSVDISALVVAMAGAWLLIPFAAGLYDWPAHVVELAPLFPLLIVFVTHATPNGVLRLFDRVEVLALQHGLNATVRLAMVGGAVLLDGDAVWVVVAWFAGHVISGGWTIVVFLRELYARRLMPVFRVGWFAAAGEFPGLWRFLWFTNLSSASGLAVNYVTALFVGAYFGAAQAGVFEVARQLATAIARPASLMGPLLLPDFSRLAARGEWRALQRVLAKQIVLTAAAVLGVGAVLMVGIPFAVPLVFGTEMAQFATLFQLLAAGSLILFGGFALRPILLSANRPGTIVAIEVVAIAVYAGTLAAALPAFGLDATGLAMIAFAATINGMFFWRCQRILRRRAIRAEVRPDQDGE